MVAILIWAGACCILSGCGNNPDDVLGIDADYTGSVGDEIFDPEWPESPARLAEAPGITRAGTLTDPDAFADYLLERGIAPEQAMAIREQDFTLDRFLSLLDLQRRCLESVGIVVDPEVQIDESDGYPYPSLLMMSREESPELDMRRSDQCHTRFSADFGSLYVAAVGPSEQEQLAADIERTNRVLGCARSEGVEVPFESIETPADLDSFSSWFQNAGLSEKCHLIWLNG